MSHWVNILLGVCVLGVISMAPESSLFAEGPRTLKLGNVELQSNGSGFRKKSLLTLYEGTLYLQQRSRNAATVIEAEAPMAIRIQITSGFVSQQKMLDALNDGFQNATGGNTKNIAAEIQEFRKCFGDPISKDDVFVMSYVPESGVSVYKNGQHKGLIAGAEFKRAVFGIWLSSRPADEKLKRAMLGN